MNKDGPVVKVKVTPKQLHSMIHKRQARLPLGYQVTKGGSLTLTVIKKVCFINLLSKTSLLKTTTS
ncbi:hypothetical protein [Bacillus subtilis]|uniref:hypothetical protein n=1 Tax=Bacillus subtilis TaxID=1423 RepID=UPI000CFFDA99|nr:hypothetical protein [Bacillus subtilis]AVL07029.1 hypothetical protein BS21228_22290 [Bacillus subtilis]QOR93752.1 hypothetical protein IMZ18_22320 [Bacillus subtilis subsp. subtilis]UJC58350.1 hypothetical protein JWY36_22095 [Bacillus subtilis]